MSNTDRIYKSIGPKVIRKSETKNSQYSKSEDEEEDEKQIFVLDKSNKTLVFYPYLTKKNVIIS